MFSLPFFMLNDFPGFDLIFSRFSLNSICLCFLSCFSACDCLPSQIKGSLSNRKTHFSSELHLYAKIVTFSYNLFWVWVKAFKNNGHKVQHIIWSAENWTKHLYFNHYMGARSWSFYSQISNKILVLYKPRIHIKVELDPCFVLC